MTWVVRRSQNKTYPFMCMRVASADETRKGHPRLVRGKARFKAHDGAQKACDRLNKGENECLTSTNSR